MTISTSFDTVPGDRLVVPEYTKAEAAEHPRIMGARLAEFAHVLAGRLADRLRDDAAADRQAATPSPEELGQALPGGAQVVTEAPAEIPPVTQVGFEIFYADSVEGDFNSSYDAVLVEVETGKILGYYPPYDEIDADNEGEGWRSRLG